MPFVLIIETERLESRSIGQRIEPTDWSHTADGAAEIREYDLRREERTPFDGGSLLFGGAANQFVFAVQLTHQSRRSKRGNEFTFERGEPQIII